MRLRSILLGFILAGVLAATASASDVSFVRVWPGWRETDIFKRISEYFDAHENPSHRTILRSHPEERTGCYFTVRVKNTGPAAAGAKFLLHVITPDSPEPRVFPFSTEVPPGEPVYEIGLTGLDWPSRKIHPVAWRLELLASDGKTLAAAQSFLWSK